MDKDILFKEAAELLKIMEHRCPLHRNSVHYSLCNSKEEASSTAYSGACFSALLNQLTANKKFNCICYKPRSNKFLTKEESKRYIADCVENKLLPEHITSECVDKGEYIFDTTINKALLYVYLTNIRHLEEEVDLLKAVLFMLDKGIPIFAGLMIAGQIACVNGGHNYLPSVYGYDCKSLLPCVFSLNTALGLKRFILMSGKYPRKEYGMGGLAQVQKSTADLDIPNTSIRYYEFADQTLVKAFKADTVEEMIDLASDFVKKYKKPEPVDAPKPKSKIKTFCKAAVNMIPNPLRKKRVIKP